MPTAIHRILVIEDDPNSRAMLSASLSRFGFQVTTTDSVLSASQLIDQEPPSAILLDVVLPFRSGAALLADLKADARTADIPVFVISELPEVLTDERRALAEAVIRKPYHPTILARLVQEACDARQPTPTDSASSRLQESLGSIRDPIP